MTHLRLRFQGFVSEIPDPRHQRLLLPHRGPPQCCFRSEQNDKKMMFKKMGGFADNGEFPTGLEESVETPNKTV